MAFQFFEEDQKTNLSWLYVLVMVHWPFFIIIYKENGFQADQIESWIPIFSMVFELLVITWINSWRCLVKADLNDGIEVQFHRFPAKNKKWQWDEIKHFAIVPSSGFNIGSGSKFWGKKRYTEYKLNFCDYQLQIHLKNGKIYRFSTDKKQDWNEFISQNKLNSNV